MEEGFYLAHLRDKDLLCHVHTTEEGIFAKLPNGRRLPVSQYPMGNVEYILVSNLKSCSPDNSLEEALNIIKFIYTNSIHSLEKFLHQRIILKNS